MGKSSEARTNFAQFSHQQLYAMLYAGNPDSARNAAATWNDTGNSLHDQANQLAKQLNGFSQEWQGGAANQYQTMMNDLIGGIRKVADTAYHMRDLAYDVADAQDTARREMPLPVDVPAVPPATLALASAPIQVDAGTPAAVVAQIQQARAGAISAVQAQQQASAAADAAQAEAVQVMTTLANAYVTAQDSIPPAPDAETAPALPTGTGVDMGAAAAAPIGGSAMLLAAPMTDPTWSQSGDLNALPDPNGDPTSGLTTPDPSTQQDDPLFGGMFSAGVAAASAAVFGRFGSLIPKVPGFANKSGGKGAGAASTDKSAGTTDTPKLGDRLAAAGGGGAKIGGAGGIGGLKAGGVGAGGVGGTSAPAPSASPAALGAGNVAGDVASGVAGAAGAAARGATGMPMMPMMPMGGMMGGDMGGGRRVPPWLVETEDVWGESSAVAPGVIGEDPGQGWLG
jgi:uncharacterized protein YukE